MLKRLGVIMLVAAMLMALLPHGAYGTGDEGGGWEEWDEPESVAYPPKDLKALPGDGHIVLMWRNCGEGYAGTLVLRSETRHATSPEDVEGQTAISDDRRNIVHDDGLTNGTDYYYTLFNRTETGLWSEAATVSAFPGVPTRLAAWADREAAFFEGGVTLWGRLEKLIAPSDREAECEEGEDGELYEGEPIEGRDDVTVWRSQDHGETWSQDGTATWDPERGLYTASAIITVNTKFQFRFAGDKTADPVLAASRSGWVYVPCMAGVKRPYNSKVVRKRAAFAVTGKYLHRPAGRVRVYFFRKVGSKWVRQQAAYAGNASGERYVLRQSLPTEGTWYMKGYYRDARHAPTWTSKRYFYVR